MKVIALPIMLVLLSLCIIDEYATRPYLFYKLPIVKFWTNTLFYCAFLFVQGYGKATKIRGRD